MPSRRLPCFLMPLHRPAAKLLACFTVSWAFAAILASPLHAEVTIRTAAQENAEPRFTFSSTAAGMQMDGLCMDVMHAIERIDSTLRFVLVPQMLSLPRIRTELANGGLDAFCGLPRTPDNESAFRFIDPPLYSTRLYLAVRADDQVTVRNWDDVRELGPNGVVLVTGQNAIEHILKKVNGLKIDASASDPAANVRKLLAGRGRFFLHHGIGLRNAIRAAQAESRVKVLPVPMERQAVYMVLSKSVPAEIGLRIHDALFRLAVNRELEGMLAQWDIE